MIYLDLDGVLVDWVGPVCALMGKPGVAIRNYSMPEVGGLAAVQARVPDTESWWASLPKREGADELVARMSLLGPVAILSNPDWNYSASQGKFAWVQRNYPALIGKVYLTGAKHKLAGPRNFLVDDHEGNVDSFTAAGGRGILYPATWNRLGEIHPSEMLDEIALTIVLNQ